jgi:plastocyanin
MKAILTAVGLLSVALAVGATAAAEGPTATTSATKTVEVVDFAFRPATVNVGKGDRVVFANRAPRAHTATRAGTFDTKRIKPGRSVGVRFGQKGTFPYHCKIHPSMRGRVVVN